MVTTASITREVPYCTICLVACTVLCHVLVLAGNLHTASTLTTIGRSTVGWSLVGSGVARALADDLDVRMNIMAENMTQALNQTVELQEYLDVVVALTSSGLDAAQGESVLSVSFLQQYALDEKPFSQLPGLMSASLDKVVEALIEKAVDLLDGLFDVLRPVLEQVGRWILQFGDKIQAIVDAFSGTLDQVQKLLDQLMSQLHGGGAGEDNMIHDTYNLFDPENNGYVTADGLHQVADLYALTALAGNKSMELVDKYDQDGDGKLLLAEFTLMVQDDSVPNLMAAVLRTYAQKLAEVAGNVGSARMRDEVATTVVRYFGLVCAKNMTKVTWVSDRLTNGSLPLEFTADILAQLCLGADDPNKLTTADVGDIVITKMMELNSTATLAAFDLVSDPTFWVTEGLPSNDQPRCVEMLTSWVMNATSSGSTFLDDQMRMPGELSTDALLAMPAMARRLASERMLKLRKEEQQKRMQRRQELLSNAASAEIVARLLGGALASEGNDPAAINEALNSGVPAHPETLEFAQYLSQNASSTAARFQKQCMDYTSQSSGPMDSVATVVQGMTKKFTGFLAMMEKYATPEGLDALEAKVKDFALHAADDAKLVIEQKLGKLLNQTAPAIADSLEGAIHSAGTALSHTLGQTLGQPLAEAVGKPLGTVIGKVANNTAMGAMVGEKLGDVLSEEIVNVTEQVLGNRIGDVLESVIDGALEHVANELHGQNATASSQEAPALDSPVFVSPHADDPLRYQLGKNVLAAEVSLSPRQPPNQISGAWVALAGMLTSITKLLPASTGILKYVRLEVSKLTHQLENIFSPLRSQGPDLFNTMAWYWRLLWSAYFLLMLCLLTGILFYAFWASGFFGGPAIDTEVVVPAARTWRERISVCWSSCSSCMSRCHDGHLCLWSSIIVMQVIVLLLFVVSLLLCILAGVKVFITSGCSKVYILTDELVCGESLTTIRSWLDSFYVADAMLPLEEVCARETLLTCSVIAKQLQVSMLLTTVFSFLAVVLSMQITVDTAILHERARWHRVMARMQKEDKGQ